MLTCYSETVIIYTQTYIHTRYSIVAFAIVSTVCRFCVGIIKWEVLFIYDFISTTKSEMSILLFCHTTF